MLSGGVGIIKFQGARHVGALRPEFCSSSHKGDPSKILVSRGVPYPLIKSQPTGSDMEAIGVSLSSWTRPSLGQGSVTTWSAPQNAPYTRNENKTSEFQQRGLTQDRWR